MKNINLSALFLATMLLGSPPAYADVIGKASVTDGDTLEIRDIKIRLHGIDAPESDQLCSKDQKRYRCGQQAALALDELIDSGTVRCEEKDTDRYGRTVAECFVGATNINAWMVENGWALAYRSYSNDYIRQEDMARTAKVGIWSGDFQNPWDYRRGPTEAETAESAGCLIKGNINSSGKQLYHMPGTTAYGRTKIDENKGERWFCSEAEAISAGWLPVKP